MSSTSRQPVHQKDRPAPARTVILAKSRKTLGNAFTMLRDFDAGVVWPRDALPRSHGIQRRDELGAVNLFHSDLDGTGRERPRQVFLADRPPSNSAYSHTGNREPQAWGLRSQPRGLNDNGDAPQADLQRTI